MMMRDEVVATLTKAVRSALEEIGLQTLRTEEFFGTNERKVTLRKAA